MKKAVIATLAITLAACSGQGESGEGVGEARQAVYDPVPGPSEWEDVEGADVEAGATNTQTAEKARQAAKLVKSGEKFMLGHVYEPEMPVNPTVVYDLQLTPTIVFASQGFNGEVMTASIGQMGTQLDALGHFGWLPPGGSTADDLVFYGGFTGADVHGPNGLLHLGAEKLKAFFTRGVLIDVRRHLFDNQVLPSGYEITLDDMEEVLDEQKMDWNDIEEGDVVLFTTGWEENWTQPSAVYYAGGPGDMTGGTPGIGLEVAEHLASLGIACVGSDNWGVEVMGVGNRKPTPPGIPYPVHHHLQVKHGISHQESMHLSDLADSIAAEHPKPKKKDYFFAYTMTPLPIKGATGSPGIPMAIR